MYRYFKMVQNSVDKISLWESKGLSNDKTSSINASSSGTESKLVYDNARIKLRFIGLLSQDKVTYNHGPTVNIYIVYILTPDTKDSDITLENCLCGAVKLTKSVRIDLYKYSGYGIGFGSKGSFSHPSGEYGNNNTINILVLGKDFIQGIGNTKIYAEKMYITNLQ